MRVRWAAGLLAASLTVGCGATGDDGSADAPSGWAAPEARLESVVVHGTGPTPLRDPLEGQWGDVVRQVHDRVRGDLVQSGPAAGDDPAYLVLRDAPDAWLRARLARLPADTRVYWGAPLAPSDLSAVGIAVHGALSEQATYEGDRSGAGDLGTRVVVTYGTTDGRPLDPTALAAVLEEAASSYPDHRLPVPVDLVHDPSYAAPSFQ